MNRVGWLVLITLVATLFAPPTLAHESRAVLAASPETLGHVHFPISCSPAAQEQFDRALAMLHSFWFPQGPRHSSPSRRPSLTARWPTGASR